ncbi:sensor domain-containing diguanylate cyclase [Clostridium isatidis]|uniref:Histidine kinase n=1 Tax=Clostridium isatidis TaxID=182773 RepID=A0A343JDC7_9CLOT|nr:sensor domain-containing diguanylate cyclase [Clostridium isatidis]ASW43535.1 histidine kinase [Clostridium isatidis]
MDDYKFRYHQLKMEYEGYQKITEEKIQQLSSENIQYQKNLDMLSNVILISNYINSNLSSNNIISMINDMIIGIIGVAQSTIYLFQDFKFVIKATNGTKESIKLTNKCKGYISKKKTFIINSKEPIVEDPQNKIAIHSRMGVPIKVGDKFIGYIIVDHPHYNFLTDFHEIFLSSIASQIAIALENSMLYKQIERAAQYDALIGVYNRKTFYNIIEERLASGTVNKYAIVMIDLDNFKQINDTLGHQFGDKVLIETAGIISSRLKEEDIIARYGGEELILYLNCNNDERNIYEEIDEIRNAISNHIVSKEGANTSITASFGVAFYPLDGENLERVINSADKLLYKAKSEGKNKVEISQMFIKESLTAKR